MNNLEHNNALIYLKKSNNKSTGVLIAHGIEKLKSLRDNYPIVKNMPEIQNLIVILLIYIIEFW